MKFKMKVYPNAKLNGEVGFIIIKVNVQNPTKVKWNSIKIHIAESSAEVFLTTNTITPKEVNEDVRKSFEVTQPFMHRLVFEENNAAYFPEGVLTVKVIISICGEEMVTHKLSKLPEKSVTPTLLKGKLTGDLKKMLENNKFSDFRIICQGEVIPCHRAILSSRSEIFGAMLEHNMKESETGEVEINDFNLRTMKAVVLYMYTGEVEQSQENAEQLMKAADKYGLEELKKSIEDELLEGVRIENAIDMFVLGDAVHADKLRATSKETIVRNAVAIVKIDGWKEALGRFQDLTLEILESVINCKETV